MMRYGHKEEETKRGDAAAAEKRNTEKTHDVRQAKLCSERGGVLV